MRKMLLLGGGFSGGHRWGILAGRQGNDDKVSKKYPGELQPLAQIFKQIKEEHL